MQFDIPVIYGSVRSDRQGIKAALFMVNTLAERGHRATLLDANEHEHPLLDRMYKEFEPGTAPEPMDTVARILQGADGYVIVCAEYNHSVPPALKNLLDHYQKEYLYKPSAIVTYSAGPFGGVRGLVNMRGILAELGTPSIPSAFPISAVQDAFDEDGRPSDPAYARRVVKFLDEFEWYAEALKRQREKETCETRIPTQQNLCRGDG
ncbi:MAG: NADPH-dependent FMN reductase [Xanthomonadales bacterium]|nr:NADPH-dependent FMN reductase [Xanthomonadales bacterium]